MIRRPPVAPLAFGLLLVAMSGGQLTSFGAFVRALEGYAVVTGVRPLAAAVVTAELVAAAGLLASASMPPGVGRTGGLVGLAVAAFWAALAGQAFARGLELRNCGCFGAYLAQPLRWWVLLEDAYLLVLAWYAAAGAGLPLPRPAVPFLRPGEAA